MDKTFVPTGQIEHEWVLVDANEQTLGRLATQIARYLLGKHRPNYTPGVATGDYVVVVNASRIQVTGNRLDEKFYHKHSGYPGGLKSVRLRDQIKVHPDRVIRSAVWGMLPHNKLGRKLIKNLKVYGGTEHRHQAQHPTAVA
ncbi:MAG TPA: 50S ribosomal protein L13 [Anaerolineaceae bacterium]